jgi:hypothetical protein
VGKRVQALPSGDHASGNAEDSATQRYVLSNATVESRAGGPLVSYGTSFALDRVPEGAQVRPNKLVRVTGEIDERPAGGGGAAASPNPREDIKANSLTVAGDPITRIRVETIQIVAQDCSSSR